MLIVHNVPLEGAYFKLQLKHAEGVVVLGPFACGFLHVHKRDVLKIFTRNVKHIKTFQLDSVIEISAFDFLCSLVLGKFIAHNSPLKVNLM